MKQLAVVTGGGSGVGQATVLALVNAGWSVVALGRRRSALEETRSLAGSMASCITAIECDIGQHESVREVGRRIESESTQQAQTLLNELLKCCPMPTIEP